MGDGNSYNFTREFLSFCLKSNELFSDIQEEKEKPSSDTLVDLTAMADGIQGDVC